VYVCTSAFVHTITYALYHTFTIIYTIVSHERSITAESSCLLSFVHVHICRCARNSFIVSAYIRGGHRLVHGHVKTFDGIVCTDEFKGALVHTITHARIPTFTCAQTNTCTSASEKDLTEYRNFCSLFHVQMCTRSQIRSFTEAGVHVFTRSSVCSVSSQLHPT
jgi:hypothetical protein